MVHESNERRSRHRLGHKFNPQPNQNDAEIRSNLHEKQQGLEVIQGNSYSLVSFPYSRPSQPTVTSCVLGSDGSAPAGRGAVAGAAAGGRGALSGVERAGVGRAGAVPSG